jgi:protein phosphatase
MPSAKKTAPPEDPQEKALHDAFLKFDVNGDGKIQSQEFMRLMTSLGSFKKEEIQRLFSEADTDKSGGVDWREFIKWICSGKAQKDLGKDAIQSFTRFLQAENADEAHFIDESAVSHALRAYLKETDKDKTEKDDENALKRKLNKTKQKMSQDTKQDARGAAVKAGGEDPLGVGPDYKGFRLQVPVTFEGAKALMHHYLLNGDKNPLHPKYVAYLTTEFTAAYKTKHPKAVVHVDTPKPGKLIIVGDTHGQLADVLHIFHQLGPPADNNRYLFNGDIADRGSQAVEILMILYSFFLAEPNCLVINRGNHENEDMNALDQDSGGGFSDEVMRKYGLVQYRRFLSAFKALGLCSVVEKEIFVVHGGLTRVKSLSIDYINSIEHGDCTAPHPMSTNIKDQIFSDLIWSDPTEQQGKYKSERGIGIKFGPDITTKFCMQNRLRFVVRSHQVPHDGHGYMKQHEGRCVTIFSASNYCGNGGNYGAVLALASEHFPKYEIYEHFAAPLAEMPKLLGVEDLKSQTNQQYDSSQDAAVVSRWEKELERMIMAIIEKKPSLWVHLIDMSMGNIVSLEDWVDMMTELVEANHPWADAAKTWGIVSSDNTVEMGAFLRRWVVSVDSAAYASFLEGAVKHVYEAILKLELDLGATLKLFDSNGDGKIELKEVRQVLGMFDLGLTPRQLDRLTGQIFLAVAGNPDLTAGRETEPVKIDVQAFLGRFCLVYKTAGAQLEKWMLDALDEVAKLIMRTPAQDLVSDLDKAAMTIQRNFRGSQARKEVKGLKGEPTTSKELAPQRDASRQKVTASPTKGALSPSPTKGDLRKAGGAAPEAVGALPKMQSLFSALDNSGDGVLDIQEFVKGFAKVKGITDLVVAGEKLTTERIMSIAKAIDTTGNGTINYIEFLQAFETSGEGQLDIGDTLGEDITTLLFRHRLAIRMGCLYLDEEASGKIRASDFTKVLQGINSVLARPEKNITSTQIDLLVEALATADDKNEPVPADRLIDYDAMMRAFVILDTEQKGAVVKRFSRS